MTTPNDRYLTLERLRLLIDEGDVDTVVMAFTDMQGRLQGKRLHGALLPRRRARGRHRGLQLPARGRHRHEHRRRLRDLVVGARLRRHGVRARLVTLRLLPHLPGHRDGAVRPGLARPRAGAPVAAHDPAAPARQGRRARAWWRSRAPSWSSSPSTRRTRTPTTSAGATCTPVNQYNVDYSILGTSRVEPLLRDIRNHMYAAGLDVEGAKGECNFGQHEIGFLYADAMIDRRQPQRLQDRGQGDRRPARPGDHVHGQVQRARGQLLPHPPVAARRRRRRRLLGRRRAHAALRPVHRRRAGDAARVHAALRAERQLLQAVRGRLVRADGRRLGPGQPHLRGPPGRPRAQRPHGEPAARAATSTPTSPSPAMLAGGLHGIDERARRSRTSWSATPTTPTSRTCRTPCARPATCSPAPTIARAAFGDEVVDHYVNMADVELAAFDAHVTDWELARSFERM